MRQGGHLVPNPRHARLTTCPHHSMALPLPCCVQVWDFARVQTEQVLAGHGGDVKSVDWHPSKGLLVSGAWRRMPPLLLLIGCPAKGLLGCGTLGCSRWPFGRLPPPAAPAAPSSCLLLR